MAGMCGLVLLTVRAMETGMKIVFYINALYPFPKKFLNDCSRLNLEQTFILNHLP